MYDNNGALKDLTCRTQKLFFGVFFYLCCLGFKLNVDSNSFVLSFWFAAPESPQTETLKCLCDGK